MGKLGSERRTQMLKSMVTMVFVTAFCCSMGTALAERISISGTHSKSEIAKTCGKVDGDSFTVPNGGYGCANGCKDSSGELDVCTVTCNKEGKCEGSVPDRRVDEKDIRDVLNNSVVGTQVIKK
jgi:hypothetical protein